MFVLCALGTMYVMYDDEVEEGFDSFGFWVFNDEVQFGILTVLRF